MNREGRRMALTSSCSKPSLLTWIGVSCAEHPFIFIFLRSHLHLCLELISTYCPRMFLSVQSLSLHVINSFPIGVVSQHQASLRLFYCRISAYGLLKIDLLQPQICFPKRKPSASWCSTIVQVRYRSTIV
jgi:hypothetical protein